MNPRTGTEIGRWLVKAAKIDKSLFIMRVENSCLPGTPDVHVAYKNHTFWLELKSRFEHKRSSQRLWSKQYVEAGGVVLFVKEVERNKFLVTDPRNPTAPKHIVQKSGSGLIAEIIREMLA